MSTTISILGCGPTGIQTAVNLLEHYPCVVKLFNDSAVDFSKGIALDCMQASVMRGWQGKIKIADTLDELADANILIVCENTEHAVSQAWEHLAKQVGCVIFAGCNVQSIVPEILSNVYSDTILGVHGIVDARYLEHIVAEELQIARDDVNAMVFGDVGKHVQSRQDFIRVHGIPINALQDNLFETVMKKIRTNNTYEHSSWNLHYTFAAATVELVLIMESGNNAVLPITMFSLDEQGTNIKARTCPCKIGNYGIQQKYAQLTEGIAG